MTALCSGKICTIFPEKGALNFWKACTIALEYSHKKQINDLLRNMRENLSSEKMILLNQLLDAISVCDGAFASEAYLQGVVEGIALCKKKIKSV